ncbi:MAG: biosynthetic arginine decarboxylase [Rhodothermales bacterium]
MQSNTSQPDANEVVWTPADAEELYRIKAWGDDFYFVNDKGHVAVKPAYGSNSAIDISHVVKQLEAEGVHFPVLIRFQDILRARVAQLNEAFRLAISEAEYKNRYMGVFPIKVNQLHEVVEEVLEAGEPYGYGLESGSKTELIATLPHLVSDDTPLLCNGYKDASMLRLILMGQRLGKNVVPIMEKYNEFERLVGLAEELNAPLRFGVRVRLSTSGVGRWADSGGDLSKFGVSIPELITMVDELKEKGQTEGFELLHFHMGSQISDIQMLKRAIKEITQIYVQLRKKGVPLKYLDVGGGLGVNYEAETTGSEASINYTLQEYANAIVYAVKEVCDMQDTPHPVLISESGRAITAHHSVLVVEVLNSYKKDEALPDFEPAEDDHAIVRELFNTLQWVRETPQDRLPVLLEAYHDAVEKRHQAESLFSFGYLSLEQKALTERLYWTICRQINVKVHAGKPEWLPPELTALDDHLVDQYLCDFSVFQSMIDHWAIGQTFPIMPLQRLDEEPGRRAVLVDLTCDSDGKVSTYVSSAEDKRFLELHELRQDEPYYLGFFLMGAYQDIMGDIHNLFGRVAEAHVYLDDEEADGFYIEKIISGTTVEEMLAMVQYFPNDLLRRMENIIRKKVSEGAFRPREGVALLEQYKKAFKQTTYYQALDT